ncbi:MAG: hypothetical protein Q6J68_04260 [Thermostichales cyanobacterium SZTDM-1c_bins_54]
MKIAWESCIYGGTVPVTCAVCGSKCYPIKVRSHHFVVAVLYDNRGHFRGEVCRSCAQASPEHIKQQLQERLVLVRQQAAELESLLTEEVECPPLEAEFRHFRV